VLVGPFPDVALPPAAFDLVVLIHVFEHLPDPREALRRVRELLAPGGRAVFVQPNPRSLGARLFGPAWVGWEPPRHLSIPSIAALASAAPAAGLRLRQSRTRSRFPDDFAHSRAFQAGRAPGPIGLRDRALRVVAAALCAVGADYGEELVVVLARSD
jgi:SAM-dependent methyltransferase